MHKIISATVIALSLASVSLGIAGPANAAVGVSLDLGNVAVGYSDGYMDNNHQYHSWENRSDATRFRAAHKSQYHSYKHDDPRSR